MHKGFLLLLRSAAHLCAISALYAVPPEKERLPAVFLCFDQWSVKNMFLFLCSFSIAFWGCLVLFYFCLRFIKNFQIIREEFPFFSQFFTIHLNCCGGLDIVRNPGGRHTQALVGYATLPRFCTKLCLQGFFA